MLDFEKLTDDELKLLYMGLNQVNYAKINSVQRDKAHYLKLIMRQELIYRGFKEYLELGA